MVLLDQYTNHLEPPTGHLQDNKHLKVRPIEHRSYGKSVRGVVFCSFNHGFTLKNRNINEYDTMTTLLIK